MKTLIGCFTARTLLLVLIALGFSGGLREARAKSEKSIEERAGKLYDKTSSKLSDGVKLLERADQVPDKSILRKPERPDLEIPGPS
jgi:hypothetical protein